MLNTCPVTWHLYLKEGDISDDIEKFKRRKGNLFFEHLQYQKMILNYSLYPPPLETSLCKKIKEINIKIHQNFKQTN